MPEARQPVHAKRPEIARPSRRSLPPPAPIPPILRDYMDGSADLVRELEARYLNPPLMSLFRSTEPRPGVRSAVLATQDGAATLTVEYDRSGALEWSYRLSAMIGQRFLLRSLSEAMRTNWLDVLREGNAEPAFLWPSERWSADYLIGSAHRYYTNVFAFSPQHAEAAARLTPEAARRLLDWLQAGWFPPTVQENALVW